MLQSTATLIVAIVGIAGTFGSGIVSQRMARDSARDEWIRDKRSEEFRELLSAISAAYIAIATFDRISGAATSSQIEAAKSESFRALHDRVFIADELMWADILVRWDEAVTNFENGHNSQKFGERFTDIKSQLVQMANRPPEKARSLRRRWMIRRLVSKFFPR